MELGTGPVQPAVLVLVANQAYKKLFAERDHDGLLAATADLFRQLNAAQGIRQVGFTAAGFRVFLRLHNTALFGDDIISWRPTFVDPPSSAPEFQIV